MPILYARIYLQTLRHNKHTHRYTHIVLNGSQCCSIIEKSWCNWQHAFWHVMPIHRQRKCRKTSHTPCAASFFSSSLRTDVSLPLNSFLSLICLLLPFRFTVLSPFMLSTSPALQLHLSIYTFCKTFFSLRWSTSLTMAALVLLGITYSISPTTVLFTPLSSITCLVLWRIHPPCSHTFISLWSVEELHRVLFVPEVKDYSRKWLLWSRQGKLLTYSHEGGVCVTQSAISVVPVL